MHIPPLPMKGVEVPFEPYPMIRHYFIRPCKVFCIKNMRFFPRSGILFVWLLVWGSFEPDAKEPGRSRKRTTVGAFPSLLPRGISVMPKSAGWTLMRPPVPGSSSVR